MLTIEQVEKANPRKKYTLAQAAEALEVSYPTIIRWKNDKRITVKIYSRSKQCVTGQAILECEKRAERPAI